MRRTILLLSATALTLLVVSGVALALTKIGGPGHDIMGGGPLRSSPQPCEIAEVHERPAASDVMSGGPGDDLMTGKQGADVISGGRGDDELGDGEAHGGAIDTLSGGPGDDLIIPINDPAG